MIRSGGRFLLVVLTASIAAACDSSTDSTTPSTGGATVAPTSAAELPRASEAPATSSPGTAPDTEADTEAAAACSAEVILPVVRSLFPDNEAWNIVDVQVADCRNGYARVFAVPDTSSCADPDVPCLENEQVYLRDDAGTWVYVDSGTGVECANPEGLLPETIEACEALGLLP